MKRRKRGKSLKNPLTLCVMADPGSDIEHPCVLPRAKRYGFILAYLFLPSPWKQNKKIATFCEKPAHSLQERGSTSDHCKSLLD